jgi:hypothetical protein
MGVFVGRERELTTLAAFLAQTISGRTQVVFIAGEAGAGKSSSMGEFVRRAEEANAEPVAARSEPLAQLRPTHNRWREFRGASLPEERGVQPLGGVGNTSVRSPPSTMQPSAEEGSVRPHLRTGTKIAECQ